MGVKQNERSSLPWGIIKEFTFCHILRDWQAGTVKSFLFQCLMIYVYSLVLHFTKLFEDAVEGV
jgi:hypothetical protein